MDVFFTSDLHFDHANVIQHAGRPFSSVEEMNERLIENWNRCVRQVDHVYHLGDFGFGKKQRIIELLDRLNGSKHMIFGNHDKELRKVAPSLCTWAGDYKEIKVAEQKIILFHYRLTVFNQGHRGAWHLHGHSHGNLPVLPRARVMDVGVDAKTGKALTGYYAPYHFEEIRAEMATRSFEPLDHHREREEM